MKALDYKLLLALDDGRWKRQNFERAAQRCITSPPSPQRIEQLEQQICRDRSSSSAASRCRHCRARPEAAGPLSPGAPAGAGAGRRALPDEPGPHPGQHRRQCRQPGYLVPAALAPLLEQYPIRAEPAGG